MRALKKESGMRIEEKIYRKDSRKGKENKERKRKIGRVWFKSETQ